MKTIQQYFQSIDEKDVIDAFLFKYPLQIKRDSLADSNSTCVEVFKSYTDNLHSLIDKIRNIEPVSDGETWILFGYHIPDGDFYDTDFALVKLSEIENNRFKQSWGYEFTKLENAVCFNVADTYLTQYYIHDLLASFLFEMSFFGWNQEYLDETLDELVSSSDYVENNLDSLLEDSSLPSDMFSELEKRDDEEYDAYKIYQNACLEYITKCYEIEEKKVINMLKGQE